jgi:hypothetical protein
LKIRLSQSGRTVCQVSEAVTPVCPHFVPTDPFSGDHDLGNGTAGASAGASSQSQSKKRKNKQSQFNRNLYGPNFTPAGKACILLNGRGISAASTANPLALAQKIAAAEVAARNKQEKTSPSSAADSKQSSVVNGADHKKYVKLFL